MSAFIDRVWQHLPSSVPSQFHIARWRFDGRPTGEALGLLPAPGIDVAAVAARILDVDRYRGNVDHVEECRSIADARFSPPQSVRFYQRVKLPVLGAVQSEMALRDLGERDGWRVLAWDMLAPETNALNPRQGARMDYNVGAWLIRPDALGYALSSSPSRKDVGRLKFAALTKGADAGAGPILKGNIEGMLRWSRR